MTLSLVVDCGNAVFSPISVIPGISFDTPVTKDYFRESPMSKGALDTGLCLCMSYAKNRFSHDVAHTVPYASKGTCANNAFFVNVYCVLTFLM